MHDPIDPLDPVAVRERLEAHRDAQERLVRFELISMSIAGAIIAAALAARVADLFAS